MRDLINVIAIQLHEATKDEYANALRDTTKIGTRIGMNSGVGKTEKEQFDNVPHGYVEGIGKVTEVLAKKYYPNYKYTAIKEAKDLDVKMSMPLFIRLLEWAKEECKDDVQIHQVAEKLSSIGCAGMDNYEELLK